MTNYKQLLKILQATDNNFNVNILRLHAAIQVEFEIAEDMIGEGEYNTDEHGNMEAMTPAHYAEAICGQDRFEVSEDFSSLVTEIQKHYQLELDALNNLIIETRKQKDLFAE